MLSGINEDSRHIYIYMHYIYTHIYIIYIIYIYMIYS